MGAAGAGGPGAACGVCELFALSPSAQDSEILIFPSTGFKLTPVSGSGDSLTSQAMTFVRSSGPKPTHSTFCLTYPSQMIIDECPVTSPNTQNCGQCSLSDTNAFGQSFHFDIATDAMNQEQYNTFFNGVTDGSNWNAVEFVQVGCAQARPSVKSWGCIENCSNNDAASVCAS